MFTAYGDDMIAEVIFIMLMALVMTIFFYRVFSRRKKENNMSTVSGQVQNSSGAGIRAAQVVFTDQNNIQHTLIAGTFGNYSIVLADGEYTSTAKSKGYTFPTSNVTVNGDTSGYNIIAQ